MNAHIFCYESEGVGGGGPGEKRKLDNVCVKEVREPRGSSSLKHFPFLKMHCYI